MHAPDPTPTSVDCNWPSSDNVVDRHRAYRHDCHEEHLNVWAARDRHGTSPRSAKRHMNGLFILSSGIPGAPSISDGTERPGWRRRRNQPGLTTASLEEDLVADFSPAHRWLWV